MINLETFLYIEKIIRAELELCNTYSSLLLKAKGIKENDGLKKLLDQHKNRYNALLSLLKEEYR